MNKKIKVIDLLNKIANGEYPRKIKFNDEVYEYKRKVQGIGYVTEDYNWFSSYIAIDDWDDLNDEVEIIEEIENSIEELEKFDIQGLEVSGYSMTEAEYLLEEGVYQNRDKINELVKAVNQLKSKLEKK